MVPNIATKFKPIVVNMFFPFLSLKMQSFNFSSTIDSRMQICSLTDSPKLFPKFGHKFWKWQGNEVTFYKHTENKKLEGQQDEQH